MAKNKNKKKKKAVAKNNEDPGNANASISPITKIRRVVQILKQVTNCPVIDIFQTLQECNMDADKAYARLVKEEIKNKNEAAAKNNEEISNAMASIPEESREVVQRLKEITNCPENEIYQMLLECNMKPEVAVNRLVIQETERKMTENKGEEVANDKNKEVAENNKEGSDAMASIPAESREVVQSLKEITNCPEKEIYQMLQECNMDPEVAFNRLSIQDPFHVVKSRRERRKGKKYGADHGTQKAENFPDQEFRDGGETSAVRADSTQIKLDVSRPGSNAPDSKLIYRKKNETPASSATLSSAHDLSGNNINQNPSSHSESLTTENKVPAAGIDCSTSSARSAWSGTFGQLTMAEIVEMGRQEAKVSATASEPQDNIPTNSLAPTGHNMYLQDEWSEFEQPSFSSTSPVLKEDFSARNTNPNLLGSTTGTSGSIHENISQSAGSYLSYRQTLEHSTAEERATSVAEDFWKLDLDSNDKEEVSGEVKPKVIIPNHLRRRTLESSQLTFGSISSWPLLSMRSNVNLDGSEPDSAPVKHADIRNTENCEEQNERVQPVESSIPGSGQNFKRYYSYFGSHSDMSPDTSEPARGNQYEFPSYTAGYNYENDQQLNAALSQPQTSSQRKNISPSSAAMQTYTGFLPSTLWPPSLQIVREPDLSYLPSAETQSTPAMYSDLCSISRSSESSLSMAVGGVQPTQQTIPGANIAAGPAFHQQLAVHPYSQSTQPVGHHANTIGYPFSPQGYTHMPPAVLQAYAGNSTNNQSLAAALQQYEDSISAGSLPLSGAVASGYGSRRSASIPGHKFPSNPYAPRGSTMGPHDVLSSEYKESGHIMPFQQNLAMSVREPGSRTMPAVPENTYYGFPGQNQPQSAIQQNQQEQFAALGYHNLNQSRGTGSPEHQQIRRDGSLYGSPGQVRQSQLIWRNNQ